jgi:hypothetical protein
MTTPGFGIVPPDRVQADVRRLLELPPAFESLYQILRLLAKHRSHMIQWDLVSQCGSKVLGGPFAGMDFIDRSSGGCHVPKLPAVWEWRERPTPWLEPLRGNSRTVRWRG